MSVLVLNRPRRLVPLRLNRFHQGGAAFLIHKLEQLLNFCFIFALEHKVLGLRVKKVCFSALTGDCFFELLSSDAFLKNHLF